MKKISILLCVFLQTIIFSFCSKPQETMVITFEIDEIDISKIVDRSAVKLLIPVRTTLNLADWNVRSDVNWMFVSKKDDSSGSRIEISVSANADALRTGSILVTSALRNYTINIKQYGKNDVVVEDDIPVKPYGGKDSEHQPNQDISNTYDGKFTSDGGAPYHTPWGVKANFPVRLDYYFNGKESIDYIVYHTRNGNGNFGKLKVYVTTDVNRNDYTLQGEYDFKQQNAPSKISFPTGIKATGVRFEVLSGLGDFVSCDEMEFFKRNQDLTLENQLLSIFKDITCSELKDGITDKDIEALPAYFMRIAEALKQGVYDAWEKEFRVRKYAPYSNVEEWADKLMTKKYGALDNPTGVSVKKGDEVIVLVGDTYGNDISLQCIWESGTEYKQTAVHGDVYWLKPGVNKLVMKEQGQLFVMYNTDLSAANAKAIKIHIPLGSGEVTGFFDLDEHRTDIKYAELLRKATHKYFCVKGEKIMFYFHRDKMLDHLPNNILSAINLWDDIIGWQQELMGISDVRPRLVNNHIFAISPEGSYMWASDYNIGFVHTYLQNILLKDNVMAAEDNAWGPAHEIGHIHQAAINWAGCTESTNNLFSNYIIFKLGKYKSRGSGLMSVATSRFVDKQAWYNMGTATHQGEDTETHMRMNWQLWNYYHRCNFKNDFWPVLFKLMREEGNRVPEANPGKRQLTFAMMASKAANENLEDFFELWGFFEPVSDKVDQYGTYDYVVTLKMIDDARKYMRQFPKKAAAIQYLEDRKKNEFEPSDHRHKDVGDVGYYTQFKNNQQITKTVTYSRSGQRITMQEGEEAVAFEIKRGTELLFFSNFLSFDVPSSIDLGTVQIYAVQADGKRIQATLK